MFINVKTFRFDINEIILLNFERVEKLSPQEVAFTTKGTSIIYGVKCWVIEDKTKTKQNITSITSQRIDQSAWIQCGVDIKTGYQYEFTFKTERAEDSTITVQLPGKIVFFVLKNISTLSLPKENLSFEKGP